MTDHDEIRSWVEARGGHPARVKSTGSRKDPGVLRIDFPGFSGEDTLEEIEWDEFFEWFDRNGLAMLLTDEKRTRFSKLVSRKSTSRRVVKSTSAKKASTKRATSTKKATSAKKAASSKKLTSRRVVKSSSAKAAGPSKKSSTKKASSTTKAASKKTSSTRRLVGSSTSKKAAGKTTTDHDEIRKWVEARGGFPAHVKQTGRRRGALGVLRIDYPGYSGKDTLERVDWDDWFAAFDRNKLAFLHDKKRSSRFSKLVNR